MKRYGNLWGSVVAYENLEEAAKKAMRGKRRRPDVQRFRFNLENELWRLHDELQNDDYRPGAYRTFLIREPKVRMISAAPFRDRVVHHALCNVLAPVWERTFIHHSYASRPGKGTHAAIKQCQVWARQYRYALKCDIRKYVPSMDHEVLKALLARKVKDRQVLRLAGRIIDASNPQEPLPFAIPGDDPASPPRRRGLPLGNQTSQFFANVYLDPLDHYVADHSRFGAYLRYMDDFLTFGDDKGELTALGDRIEQFAAGLRLRLHEEKRLTFSCGQRHGIRFLGQRIFRSHRLLLKENVRRFRSRLKRYQRGFAVGAVSLETVDRSIRGWIGHAVHADTYRLRGRLFRQFVLFGPETKRSGLARRQLQQ